MRKSRQRRFKPKAPVGGVPLLNWLNEDLSRLSSSTKGGYQWNVEWPVGPKTNTVKKMIHVLEGVKKNVETLSGESVAATEQEGITVINLSVPAYEFLQDIVANLTSAREDSESGPQPFWCEQYSIVLDQFAERLGTDICCPTLPPPQATQSAVTKPAGEADRCADPESGGSKEPQLGLGLSDDQFMVVAQVVTQSCDRPVLETLSLIWKHTPGLNVCLDKETRLFLHLVKIFPTLPEWSDDEKHVVGKWKFSHSKKFLDIMSYLQDKLPKEVLQEVSTDEWNKIYESMSEQIKKSDLFLRRGALMCPAEAPRNAEQSGHVADMTVDDKIVMIRLMLKYHEEDHERSNRLPVHDHNAVASVKTLGVLQAMCLVLESARAQAAEPPKINYGGHHSAIAKEIVTQVINNAIQKAIEQEKIVAAQERAIKEEVARLEEDQKLTSCEKTIARLTAENKELKVKVGVARGAAEEAAKLQVAPTEEAHVGSQGCAAASSSDHTGPPLECNFHFGPGEFEEALRLTARDQKLWRQGVGQVVQAQRRRLEKHDEVSRLSAVAQAELYKEDDQGKQEIITDLKQENAKLARRIAKLEQDLREEQRTHKMEREAKRQELTMHQASIERALSKIRALVQGRVADAQSQDGLLEQTNFAKRRAAEEAAARVAAEEREAAAVAARRVAEVRAAAAVAARGVAEARAEAAARVAAEEREAAAVAARGAAEEREAAADAVAKAEEAEARAEEAGAREPIECELIEKGILTQDEAKVIDVKQVGSMCFLLQLLQECPGIKSKIKELMPFCDSDYIALLPSPKMTAFIEGVERKEIFPLGHTVTARVIRSLKRTGDGGKDVKQPPLSTISCTHHNFDVVFAEEGHGWDEVDTLTRFAIEMTTNPVGAFERIFKKNGSPYLRFDLSEYWNKVSCTEETKLPRDQLRSLQVFLKHLIKFLYLNLIVPNEIKDKIVKAIREIDTVEEEIKVIDAKEGVTNSHRWDADILKARISKEILTAMLTAHQKIERIGFFQIRDISQRHSSSQPGKVLELAKIVAMLRLYMPESGREMQPQPQPCGRDGRCGGGAADVPGPSIGRALGGSE